MRAVQVHPLASGRQGRAVVARAVSITGVCGGVLTLAVAALYAAIIISQGDDRIEQSVPWAIGFVSIGLVGIAASFATSRRRRRIAFSICAFATLVVGVLAIFSVGILLLIAGLLFVAAAGSASAGS